MKILIGADHRGFEKKQVLVRELLERGYEVEDMGATEYQADDDEPDFAVKVVRQLDEGDRGILLCGSGHGMEMAANRFAHVRAILGFRVEVVRQGREHNDANVLTIPAEWISDEEMLHVVEVFLNTEFLNKERYVRRLSKLRELGGV